MFSFCFSWKHLLHFSNQDYGIHYLRYEEVMGIIGVTKERRIESCWVTFKFYNMKNISLHSYQIGPIALLFSYVKYKFFERSRRWLSCPTFSASNDTHIHFVPPPPQFYYSSSNSFSMKKTVNFPWVKFFRVSKYEPNFEAPFPIKKK